MSNFLEVIQSIDLRFLIGWALLWFGFGVIACSIAWARSRYREAKKIIHIIRTEVGHVMKHCEDESHGGKIHVQCICGESSLMYKKDDPTAPNLMEQWEDEHITSQMESIGR